MRSSGLNARQRKFVALYEGNATKAAIQAGYSEKTAYSIGQRLLKHVVIEKTLRERAEKEIASLVANRQERQRFWTGVFKDKKTDMHNRLKASELLGRSEMDFTEKIVIPGLEGLAGKIKAGRERAIKAEKDAGLKEQ